MSYRVYMPVILEELGFKVTERWFDEVEEPDFEGDRVVLPSTPSASSSHSPSSHSSLTSTTSTSSPDTETNASNLSWFARRKANAAKAAAHKEAEQRRKEERTKAGVQRPPSYASWVGRGKGEKEKEKGKGIRGKDGELPPREGTPPIRTASPSGSIVGPVHPTADLSSRSSTPTPTPTSNSNSTTTTPLVVPLNSDHTASPLPKTAGFDFAAIKAELRELSKGVGAENEVGIVPAVEAPRMRVGHRVDNNNEEEIIEEEPEEIVEPGPSSSSSSSPPPTPPSKSPDAGYFSFPRRTSVVLTASSYNNDNNASSVSLSYNPFATTATTPAPASLTGFAATPTASTSTSTPPDSGATTTTTTAGLTFGSADGERITGSAGIGLPDPWTAVPSSSSRRREDVGNPWG
ncbi:hypothetical protein EV359DRAFT_87993 [Lentinula novae-zelandiae]|nr:hypothetical protein EV359DRAFT_87993 [Lentinula novae-zelandiae]